MSTSETHTIYEQLGIKPVINAAGNITLLGGSSLSPAAQTALATANAAFAPMEEVLLKTGAAIADMLHAERAYVTSGCFAALVQGIAGIMTGGDREKIARLPDTTGVKNEFLLQKKMRYRYDRCITTAGGKLVEVGDDAGATAEQLTAAIGPNTAGILYFARGEGTPGTLSLAEVTAIANEHDVPLIADAASEVYPLERLTSLPNSGAALICFGAKYFGSGHSTGILCGRRDLVKAAFLNSFISYEVQNNRSVGRGYKVDRQEAIATVIALREWLDTDHEERLQEEAARIDTISQALADLPHVRMNNMWDEGKDAWMRLRVSLDTDALGKSAADVVAALRAGDPSIWTRAFGDDIVVAVNTLFPDEAEIVAQRLRDELSAG